EELPTCVQVEPSADVKPVNVLPERTRRTQIGATPELLVLLVVRPSWVRVWNTTPLDGVTRTATLAEPAERSCRIITPPFAEACVFSRLATRATISTSPSTS